MEILSVLAKHLRKIMKYYKIGITVGTHTAGCNGDATQLSMPCATFFMTYNKFLNRDGSQHHGIGVLPDIYCEMQISDIQKILTHN
jgi:C-terminal processing protease CtpA/Prc